MAVAQSFSDGIVIFYVILVHSWFYVWHRVCMQWLQIGDDMEEAYTHSDLSGSSKDSASWHILRLTNQGAALDQGWRLLSVIPFWTSFSSGRDCVVVVTGKGMWILMIAWTLCSKPRNWTKWTRKTTCHCRQGQQCTYVFVVLQWQLDFLLFVLYTSNVLCLVVYVPIFSSKHVEGLKKNVLCCNLLCRFHCLLSISDCHYFANRFNSTLQMVHAAGETNRIQQGLFENYLESRVKDPYLLLVSHLQCRWLHSFRLTGLVCR